MLQSYPSLKYPKFIRFRLLKNKTKWLQNNYNVWIVLLYCTISALFDKPRKRNDSPSCQTSPSSSQITLNRFASKVRIKMFDERETNKKKHLTKFFLTEIKKRLRSVEHTNKIQSITKLRHVVTSLAL